MTKRHAIGAPPLLVRCPVPWRICLLSFPANDIRPVMEI